MPWNPDQYHQFQAERSAPFDDLLKLVSLRPGLKVVDLGCGTGELTRRLADCLIESDVLGLDNSTQMLEKTIPFQRPGLRFQEGNQENLEGKWDLIFSNAALQWSPDHEHLISHLYDQLKPSGQILVQVPSNHEHISHRLIIQTAREEPFQTRLNGFVRTSSVLPIDHYARLFFDLGACNTLVYEKVFGHILENSDAIVEWVSGTALVPYFERLGTSKDAYLAALREKMRRSFPGSPVFYPFKRTFFSAYKPG